MTDTDQKNGFEVVRQGEALKEEFSAQYGEDGQRLVLELIESGRLNGGIDLSGEAVSDIGPMQGDYYPGESYSAATGFYFMRRALGEMSADEAYDEFLLDVDGIDTTRKLNEVNGRYPSQEWLENLCQPYFDTLYEDNKPKSGLHI